MNTRHRTDGHGLAALLGSLLAMAGGMAPAHAGLRVVASVPDLGSIVESVGGDAVDVTVLTRGPQDPHYLEPRPSFIRTLHGADLFVQVGMDLEIGWAPVLLQSARNPKIRPGGAGHLDASVGIRPLQVPAPGADRSQGDLHPYGNPHYLTDPLNGLRVSSRIRDKLIELDPEHTEAYRERQQAFARDLMERLVGPGLAARHEPAELASRIEAGGLDELLAAEGEPALGGWLGTLRGFAGTRAVEEHQFWIYLANRFGLVLITTLEPFPGITPTTRHLQGVVETMKTEQVPVVLSTAYFDPRHARWVAERSGARVVPLAHQAGARAGTEGYLDTIGYNVDQLAQALTQR
jgi:ABC-type Zn uptake system ZnuABC Zn-binding protein ZnuA